MLNEARGMISPQVKPKLLSECKAGQIVSLIDPFTGAGAAMVMRQRGSGEYLVTLDPKGVSEAWPGPAGNTKVLAYQGDVVWRVEPETAELLDLDEVKTAAGYLYFNQDGPVLVAASESRDDAPIHIDLATGDAFTPMREKRMVFWNWSVWTKCAHGPLALTHIYSASKR